MSEVISDIRSFGARKVTIYVGTKKHEATDVKIYPKGDSSFVNALMCEFKPKRGRRLRYFVDYRNRKTVILDGWGHPEFHWFLRTLSDLPPIQEGGTVAIPTARHTVQAGGSQHEDKYEREFEQYLKDLDPAKILFKNREQAA